MSGQATGWVFRNGPTTRAHRLVLLAIADAANRDGEHSHPGLGGLVEGSLYSERQVRRIVTELIDGGWIEVTEDHSCGGRGLATEYRIPGVRGNEKPGHDDVRVYGAKPGHGVRVSGAKPGHNPDISSIQEPLIPSYSNSTSTARKKRAPKTPPPENFPLTAEILALPSVAEARALGIEIERERDKFLASAHANGRSYVRWASAFDNWLMNQIQWTKDRQPKDQEHVPGGFGKVW